MVVFDFNSMCNNGALKDEPSVALAIEEEFQPLSLSCSLLGPNFRAFVRRDSASIDDPGSNLARGKRANQSSQYGLTSAGAAVDGNTDGNYSNGSVTHTLLDKNSWWDVDLGASATVASIVIWNRTDFGSDRLNSYWVFVSDTPFGFSDTHAVLKDRKGVKGVWSSFQKSPPCPVTHISADNSHGRYVRIQLADEGYLSIAEVQVFGAIRAKEVSPLL